MTTYYVSTTGSDRADGTSAGTAFKTLAKAQAAMAASAGADVTLVESGTYTAGATLTSANSGDTIKAAAGAAPVLDGAGNATTFFTIAGASNVTISGLTFQDTATGGDNDTVKPAILVTSGSGELIQGNTFHSLGSGVIFDGGSGKVDGNTLNDTGSVAIRVGDGAAGVTIANNTIAHSSYGLPEGGAIELLGAGGNTVTHNAIDDSAYNGIWDESKGGNTITWNKVTNSVQTASDGGGIYAFYPAANDTIANNYVANGDTSNLNWGIYLDDNVNNTTVTGNYAQGGSGLMVHGGDNDTITDNVLIGRDFGLQVMGTGDAGSIGLSDNTQINHNLIDGQQAVAGFEWGSGNLSDYNVIIGTSGGQLGYDPGTVAQWQASGQDEHSLLDSSINSELNADGSFAARSKALQLGISQLDLSQVGPGGSSGASGGTSGGGSSSSGSGSGDQTGGTGGGSTGGDGGGSESPPPPASGDGTVDTLTLVLAGARYGSQLPHFILQVGGETIGEGDVSTSYPDQESIKFSHDWASGSHSLDIIATNATAAGALWVNDIGVQVGSSAIRWTNDNWVSLPNTGDSFHETFQI